jgi:hypothetical protein
LLLTLGCKKFKTIPDEPPIYYGQAINAVTQVSQQKTKVSENLSKKDTNIFGEEILELRVESVDALKLKQLELDHVFKIKQLELLAI